MQSKIFVFIAFAGVLSERTTESILLPGNRSERHGEPVDSSRLGRFYGVVDEDAGAGEAGREADLLYALHHYQYPPQRRVPTVQEERLVPPYFPEPSIFYGKILKKTRYTEIEPIPYAQPPGCRHPLLG